MDSRGLCSRHLRLAREADPATPRCSVEGCDRIVHARGLCGTHDARVKAHGDTALHPRRRSAETCCVEGCERPARKLGRCTLHYRRFHATGSDDLVPREVTICSVEGCERRTHGRGLCDTHIYRLVHTGTTDDPAPTPAPVAGSGQTPCREPGCERPIHGRGLCSMHYQQAHLAAITETCSVEGCDERAAHLGLCGAHYARQWRTGGTDLTPRGVQVCSTPGCHRTARSHGLCCTCAWRVARHGSPGPITHTCPTCGTRFTATDNQIYCAPACRPTARATGTWIDDVDRWAIYARDGWTCQICGLPVPTDAEFHVGEASLDHIVPWSRGGSDNPENLRLVHRFCNTVRGAGRADDNRVRDMARMPERAHQLTAEADDAGNNAA
ncbi:hypothetical protein ASQ49_02765 [Acidipropionibacterium acidipropionici]|nr:hypothetical protein ASQ49_02765 [Acidipropionibacterium acidipropionici]APZ09869.1 HNH endonuclease [Acidipropionibacterium acidipropionici]